MKKPGRYLRRWHVVAVEYIEIPPSFNPSSIAGLAIWHDGADAATVTVDGSNRVSQWDDKSGNGRHVTNADPSNQPLYESSVLNGRNALSFDGSRILTVEGISIPQPCTAFAAFKPVEPCTQTRHIFGRIAGGWSVGHFSQFPRYSAGGPPKISTTKAINIDAVNLITVVFDNLNTFMNLNTFQAASGSAGANSLSRNDVGQFFNGYIAELLCYSRVLTTEEVQQVEAYLISKWVVPATDPNDAPLLDFSSSNNSQYASLWN